MGKRPKYDVFLVSKNKQAGQKAIYTKVGVAWDMFEGTSINIMLNPGTVLNWRMTEDYYITVKENPYHNDHYNHKRNYEDNREVEVNYTMKEDEIPF